MVIRLEQKSSEHQSHLLASTLVALVAVVGLVLVFASNPPTGAFAEVHGGPAKAWITREYRECTDIANPLCHRDFCRHAPSDPNFGECGKCTPGSAGIENSNTGYCCITPNLQQAHCETYKEFNYWRKKDRTFLYSPTQRGVSF